MLPCATTFFFYFFSPGKNFPCFKLIIVYRQLAFLVKQKKNISVLIYVSCILKYFLCRNDNEVLFQYKAKPLEFFNYVYSRNRCIQNLENNFLRFFFFTNTDLTYKQIKIMFAFNINSLARKIFKLLSILSTCQS